MSESKLNKEDIHKIKKMILAWEGKLTWALLIIAIRSDLDISVSRTAIVKYSAIHRVFGDQKDRLKGVVVEPIDHITAKDISDIQNLRKDLKDMTADRDQWMKDYYEARDLINRVITNADMIPNLDVRALFDPID
jgi:hypothetical protein